MAQHQEVVCYTDGSSLANPGFSGAGAVFFGRDAAEVGEDEIQAEDQIHQKTAETFLFGVTLHVGKASNNYAEYTGVILGQLFFALFDQPIARI